MIASTKRMLLAAAVALLAPSIANAHAVVYPKASTAGSYEKYTIRVPNEKAAATTRVEIRFPADLRVTAFADVPGWTLEVVTDSAKSITSAVWTGTLPPQRFVEFPFVARNPKTGAQLTWPIYQTYGDGERVEWTGAPGSKSPASSTVLAAAPAADSAHRDSATTAGAPAASTSWVAWGALVVSLLSLGLALRPKS